MALMAWKMTCNLPNMALKRDGRYRARPLDLR